MTHAELVTLAERWLWRQNCGVVFAELSTLGTPEKPDAIGFRSETSILVECKVSRADFLADRNKPFRRNPSLGMGDWRFYLTPRGLITPEELPDGWGLLELGKSIRRTHGGPKGNIWSAETPFTGNAAAEQALLYSALRRIAEHGLLSQVYLPWDNATARGSQPEELARQLAKAERRTASLETQLARERRARKQAETNAEILTRLHHGTRETTPAQ